LKIATWNVNGIRARETQLAEWLTVEQPDVLCLQEIKAAPAQIPAAICELEGYWCYWHGVKGYSGVGLHVSRAFSADKPGFFHPAFDYENRIVAAEISGTTFASVYVPNGGKDLDAKMRFLEALVGWASELREAGRPLVICGDLNVARNPELDVHPKERKARPVVGYLPEEIALFERLFSDGGLVDVARTLHPEDPGIFTWWAPWRNLRERNIGWRIDYVLASPTLAGRAESCEVRAKVGTSDHGPLVAVFGEGPTTPAA
jgi:exodeoxyribonuclease-3